MTRRRSEDGVATVLVLGLVALLVLVAGVAVAATAVVVGHRRAQAAADLGALAAATAVQAGSDGCGAARSTVVANGAELDECSKDGSSVLVTVVVRLPASLGAREVRARARAGPAGLV